MRLIIACLFLSASLLFAGPQDIFEKGNTAYAEGNYASAKDAYEVLIFDDNLSAELFFNLGNTYFKLGENAKALLYYEKAKVLLPFDEDIQHNLDFVNEFVTDKKEYSEEIANWWASLLRIVDVATYTVISLVLSLLATLGFAYFFITNSSGKKQVGFYGGLTFLLVLLVVWLLGLQRKGLEENASHAIIMNPTVSILTEPTNLGTTKFTLHEGSKVQVLDKQSIWVRISFTDKQQGWVKNTSIEEI